ncbi:hypothetical protein Ddc_15625 [Ditylenchus destructor]|nr:hypothetical protein Ddc_15625 [Ditylenchus destructor]
MYSVEMLTVHQSCKDEITLLCTGGSQLLLSHTLTDIWTMGIHRISRDQIYDKVNRLAYGNRGSENRKSQQEQSHGKRNHLQLAGWGVDIPKFVEVT